MPKSNIRGIPVANGEEHLSLGLVEIACRPFRKRGALKCRRELLLKHWADNYRTQGVKWRPEIFRMLVHYDPSDTVLGYSRKYKPDVMVLYNRLTPEMIRCLSEKERVALLKTARRHASELSKMMDNADADGIHHCIRNADVATQSGMRGKLAEIMAQRDIESAMPAGMNAFRNGNIKYFNKRFPNGTEVDSILTFYGEQPFVTLVERMRKYDHLNVIDRWQH